MKLIKNATIINEGKRFKGSVIIEQDRIAEIIEGDNIFDREAEYEEITDAKGLLLLPGVIDMHVHFREPGLTHKGNTETETRAALAGGLTSFAEMPNTIPKTVGEKELTEKLSIAAKHSYINYSYYIGAVEGNSDFLSHIDSATVPGVKVFMGASTGNMQITGDALKKVYRQKNLRVTAHCEDDEIILKNTERYRTKFGETIPFEYHPKIRSSEACLKSTKEAVELTKRHGTRLHIAHLSTKEELAFLETGNNPRAKQITAEVCIHHLWFNEKDYKEKGAFIKWNPAIKNESDRQALLKALKDDRIDIIVTDHAPHTLEEKQGPYTNVPSGAPMVQHSLQAAYELSKQGYFTLEQMVKKMCHKPAELFGIKERGFIREGYFADLVLLNPNSQYTVNKDNILYKCGWSPMEGTTFSSRPEYVFVNGNRLFNKGQIGQKGHGMALIFEN